MTDNAKTDRKQTEELPLSKAAEFLLNECRMVLPGIQSLFGFQLIVVFSAGFSQKLSVPEQHLHLLALGLLAVAVALIMTPAAYHRAAGSREVSDILLRITSRLLLSSMIPLAIGICLDFYLVARVVLGGAIVPWLATALFAVFVTLWFIVPRAMIGRQ